MSKHTPGPWVGALSLVDGKTEIVARRPECADFDLYVATLCDGFGEEAVAANARLIAAAPELLSALERALNWLSSYPGGNAEGTYQQARDAIAKATGEKA